MEQSVEFLIKSHYAQLRASEKKVADYVLEHGMNCKKMTIDALAEESKVSQPTVMRFVKAAGFQNYKEFQYALMCQDMQAKIFQKKKIQNRYFMDTSCIHRIKWRVFRKKSCQEPLLCWKRC